jgi:hypothetical protein
MNKYFLLFLIVILAIIFFTNSNSENFGNKGTDKKSVKKTAPLIDYNKRVEDVVFTLDAKMDRNWFKQYNSGLSDYIYGIKPIQKGIQSNDVPPDVQNMLQFNLNNLFDSTPIDKLLNQPNKVVIPLKWINVNLELTFVFYTKIDKSYYFKLKEMTYKYKNDPSLFMISEYEIYYANGEKINSNIVGNILELKANY